MITIRNVSFHIGTCPILDNISLDIPEARHYRADRPERRRQVHPVFLYGAAAPA